MDPQFKMLRLESCLEGEAAETVKGLGYSEAAYDAAKKRLIRKYGGDRRNVQGHLDELRRMKQISEGNSKELERFADILERTVVTLKENNRESDLQAGTLYGIVLEKVPEGLLSQYYRWLKDQKKTESVETLNSWIGEEAEYQTHAAERKRGLGREREERKEEQKSGRGRDSKPRRSFGSRNGDSVDRKEKPCVAFGEKHPVWKCLIFKEWPGDKKWETAKRAGLCYRCLGDDHLGKDCKRTRVCSVTGCNKNHHPLLHEVKNQEQERKNQVSVTEGDTAQKTNMGTVNNKQELMSVALRTVPVILKNGKKRLLVNCFMDEGSDTTYVNEDVVEELGLQETKEPVTVQVANAQQVTFMSATVDIGIESIDGKVDSVISAKTSQKICGRMKPTNWVKIKQRWDHMRDISFPELAQKQTIDVLLGSHHYHFMFPMKEIPGKEDEPSARLCPLGWTAIGRIDKKDQSQHRNTKYLRTFRGQIELNSQPLLEHGSPDGELNTAVKRFWDLESIGITTSNTSEMMQTES